MSFLDKRINGICTELQKLSVKQKFPTDSWVYKPGNFLRPEDADADAAPFEPFDCRTMHWYGPDKHYWFRTEVTVPESFAGKSLWLHIQSQIEEWDDAKNPQFLVFVDGVVTQGADMNHRDVLLDRCAKAGTQYRLEMQARLGGETPGGKTMDGGTPGDTTLDSLYAYWGSKLAERLFSETSLILNLASKEYSKCISAYLSHFPEKRFVTCVFGELSGDRIVEKGTLAKMARGEMVRFLAERQADRLETVKAFDRLDYRFCEERSSEDRLVFIKGN